MPVYPFALKVYKAYDGAIPLVGLDTVVLPNVRFAQGTMSGAGITATTIPKIIPGVVEAMDGGSLSWHTSCQGALNLFDGAPHILTVYSDLLQEDSSTGVDAEIPEKAVLRITVSGYNLGQRANTTKAPITEPFLCDVVQLTFNGQQLWNIDPANGKCIVNGKDLNSVANSITG